MSGLVCDWEWRSAAGYIIPDVLRGVKLALGDGRAFWWPTPISLHWPEQMHRICRGEEKLPNLALRLPAQQPMRRPMTCFVESTAMAGFIAHAPTTFVNRSRLLIEFVLLGATRTGLLSPRLSCRVFSPRPLRSAELVLCRNRSLY